MKIAFVRNPKTGSSSMRRALPDTVFTDAHRRASEYEDGYTKFVFVRNPWERLHSWWRHQNYCKTETFEDYVLRRAREEQYVHGRYDTGLIIADQYTWTEGVDFIGRFENMAQDFGYICGRLGIHADPLGYLNRSIREETYPYDRSMWTKPMVHHMSPMFQPFAEEFGYTAPC